MFMLFGFYLTNVFVIDMIFANILTDKESLFYNDHVVCACTCARVRMCACIDSVISIMSAFLFLNMLFPPIFVRFPETDCNMCTQLLCPRRSEVPVDVCICKTREHPR